MTKASYSFFIIVFFILFLVSTAILLIAGTAQAPLPAWGGYLYVGIVLLIAFTGFLIYGRNKSSPRYDLSHQAVIYFFL